MHETNGRRGRGAAVGIRHCEERSDEAIHRSACGGMDCFASLAMTDQSLFAGVWMNPRLCVGLIRISFMQTRGGMLATKAMVRPRSSGCSILACSSSLGTTGRSFRIGVATSPGDRQQARRPLTHSSMLKECVSASTACLVVV